MPPLKKVIRKPRRTKVTNRLARTRKPVFKGQKSVIERYADRASRREQVIAMETRKFFYKILDGWKTKPKVKPKPIKKKGRQPTKAKPVKKIRSSTELSKEQIKAMRDPWKSVFKSDAWKMQKPVPVVLKQMSKAPHKKRGLQPKLYMKHIPKKGFYRKLSEEYPNRIWKAVTPQFRKYGPYPNPLGVEKLFEIELSRYGMKVLQNPIVKGHLVPTIIWHMRQLHRRVEYIGSSMIEQYVPADVGNSFMKDTKPNLRASLRKSLSAQESLLPRGGDWSLSNVAMAMRFFSELPYAGIVGNMPTKTVRHSPYDKKPRKSWKTGELLDDPEAIGIFFPIIIKKIKNAVRYSLLPTMFQNLAMTFSTKLTQIYGIKIRVTPSEVRSLFKVNYLGRGLYRSKVVDAFNHPDIKNFEETIRTMVSGDPNQASFRANIKGMEDIKGKMVRVLTGEHKKK
jgi:hypothetical protein